MSKQIHHLSMHVSEEMLLFIATRKKEMRLSQNAYLAYCVSLDRQIAERCEGCHDRSIADAMREVVRLSAESLPKKKTEPEKKE